MVLICMGSDGLSDNFGLDFDPRHDGRQQAAPHNHMGTTTAVQLELNGTGKGSSFDKNAGADDRWSKPWWLGGAAVHFCTMKRTYVFGSCGDNNVGRWSGG